MALNGGLGDIDASEKNVALVTYDPSEQDETLYKCSEKITAVQGADCESFWVITHFVDTFYSFKIDRNGFSDTTPIISPPLIPTISTLGYRRNAIGYIKASPDGQFIYVIDGHHKLLAYQRLNIFPEVMVMTKIIDPAIPQHEPDTFSEVEPYLWGAQSGHVLMNEIFFKSTPESTEAIDRALKKIDRLDYSLINSLSYNLTKTPDSKNWVEDRLEVLKSRFRNGNKSQIGYQHHDRSMYNNGWILIDSLEVFEDVIEKSIQENVARRKAYS